MRIWDLPPSLLCRRHLLGEHRELHAIWLVLLGKNHGYASHPETRRWVGKQAALYMRHEALVREMERRGYLHASPLDIRHATGERRQRTHLLSIAEQKSCSAPRGATVRYSPKAEIKKGPRGGRPAFTAGALR